VGHEYPWFRRLCGATEGVPAQVPRAGGREGLHGEGRRPVGREGEQPGRDGIDGDAGRDERGDEREHAPAWDSGVDADDAAAVRAAGSSRDDVLASSDDATIPDAYAVWWEPAARSVGGGVLVGGQGGESMEPQAGVGDDEARPLSKGT
jgi:hypothetical protein